MEKAIYLLLTPAYASIGDQAIAWAEERWLAAQYPDHILCVLDEEQTLRCLPGILAESPPDTLFFFTGGREPGHPVPGGGGAPPAGHPSVGGASRSAFPPECLV